MNCDLILASGSKIRADLLRSAGLSIEVHPARVDEDAIRESLLAENASARDVADALAEAKARKSAARHMGALTLGCDQVLSFQNQILSKPKSRSEAAGQIRMLSGKPHQLLSAAVLYEGTEPVWRHIGVARLKMRDISESYLEEYLDRNWPGVADSVGGYKLEEEGVRLFAHIHGDHFTILGLPLVELLNHFAISGRISA